MTKILLISGLVLVSGLILFVIMAYSALGLWFQAFVSGAKINLFSLLFMPFRKVSPKKIVDPIIMAVKAGLTIGTDELEAHHIAGGDVDKVVKALIAADKANIPLKFNRAAAIDLAGRDVLQAVQMSVNPKVIETPIVAAVARDGIQLKAMARITVKANIDRLVGGAGEDTIIAKVAEGMVSTMGSADNHKAVLEDPYNTISERVLERNLDKNTAFEILSVDISDVEVGKNIGAAVETERAEADKIIAQANAEKRRSMAIAVEQEMKARVEEMKAEVVKAEAELHRVREEVVRAEANIPLAVAEALQKGRIGIMDFYQMKNVQAETQMRDSIADSVKEFVKEYAKAHKQLGDKPKAGKSAKKEDAEK